MDDLTCPACGGTGRVPGKLADFSPDQIAALRLMASDPRRHTLYRGNNTASWFMTYAPDAVPLSKPEVYQLIQRGFLVELYADVPEVGHDALQISADGLAALRARQSQEAKDG